MDKSAIIKALRDGTQATSNGIASSMLGQPVDLIASGLDAIGVPTGPAPMDGTQWLQDKGFTRPVENGGAPAFVGDVLGQTAGNLAFAPAQVGPYIKQLFK